MSSFPEEKKVARSDDLVGSVSEEERLPTPHNNGFPTRSEDFGFTPEQIKKLKWKIDSRLVITVGIMYCVSLLDRINLSSAKIAGMDKDLELVGNNRYNIMSLVFFTTYCVFQPPATVICRKIGPRIFLSMITTLWGALMIGMGFGQDWLQLTALRVVLGVLEAGFFPSVVYLLSTWYTRYEVGKRNSLFYCIGCAASALGGILAYGIMQMAGTEGLNGWRWIFILEGTLTCVIGIVGYWALVDFPDSPRKNFKFVTDKERAWVCARVNEDRGDVTMLPFNLKSYLKPALDLKVWGFALIFGGSTTVTYALAFFMPVILNLNMGFDLGLSQILVAPPYLFAGLVMYLCAWVGDKYKLRGPIVAFNAILCIIGLPIMGLAKSPGVRYFGVFLATAGSNGNVPASMSYQANNIRGQWKRALCSATIVSFGGIGGIAGSLIFRAQDAPGYLFGLYFCLGVSCLVLVLVGVLSIYFYFQNAKADRGEKELEFDDPDATPGFRYTY